MMKITLPERVSGTKDALLILELEFPVATVERKVVVTTSGPLDAMDLKGTGPGGEYTVPVGLERLHIPLRVNADGANQAAVTVSTTGGGEEGTTTERRITLDAPSAVPAGGGSGAKLALVGLLLAGLVAGGIYLIPKLTGKKDVPDVTGQTMEQARIALQKEGFDVEKTTEDTEDNRMHGRVLRTIAKDGKVVEVVLGNFRDRLVEVPDVRGNMEAAAKAVLDGEGLSSTVRYVDADREDQIGTVIWQSPAAGTHIDLGIAIQLRIGRKADGTTQPDTPTQPETPTQPDTPDTPMVPAIPDTPEGPDTPTVPDTPAVPDTPSIPDTPTGPTIPDTPSIPDTPTQPDTPTAPAPSDPGARLMPDLSGLTDSQAQERLADLDLYAMVQEDTAPRSSDVGRVVRQTPTPGSRLDSSPQVTIYLGVRTAETDAGTRPTQPDTPSQPDTPVVPAQPDTPSVPTVPDTPSVPTVPDTPDQPAPTDPMQPVPSQPDTPSPLDPAQPEDPPTGVTPGDPLGPVIPAPSNPGQNPGDPIPDRPVTPAAAPGRVPDVIGTMRMEAATALRVAGFRPRLLLETTGDVPDGQVLSQDPSAGVTLDHDAEVIIVVAKRPPASGVFVPDVVNMSRSAAELALRGESFLVRVSFTRGPADRVGKVDSQAPAAGSIQHRRTWVEIVVVQPYATETRIARGGAPESLAGMRDGPGPDLSDETESKKLPTPPAVGSGRFVKPPPTPKGRVPAPAVDLPGPGAPASQTVPNITSMEVRAALTEALRAGLMPIVENDRSAGATVGRISGQSPAAGTSLPAGGVLRVKTGVGTAGPAGTYDLKLVLGADVRRSKAMYERAGITVDIIEVDSPGHPYAGSGRVVAQFPVSLVPRDLARRVTLWVAK